MRENLTLRFSLFSLVLLIFLLFVPVMADMPDEDSYHIRNESLYTAESFKQLNQHGHNDGFLTSSLQTLYFRDISYYYNFKAIRYYNDQDGIITLHNTTTNNSYYFCTFSDAWTGQQIGEGEIGYNRGSDNQGWYIFIYARTWNIGNLAGERLVNVSWNKAYFDLKYLNYHDSDAGTGTLENASFISTYTAVQPAYGLAYTQLNTVAETYSKWRNDYYVYKDEPTDPNIKLYVNKTFDNIQYTSYIKVNVTVNGKNSTLYHQFSSQNVDLSGLVSSQFPVYIDFDNPDGTIHFSRKIALPTELSITVDKGMVAADPLNTDTGTTARLGGTNGNGLYYLVWKWSENYDDFLSSSSGKKISKYAYRTYQYNATNMSTLGNWELTAYGFEGKGITTTSTSRGVYTWEQVNKQSVRFNWSQIDPSWQGSGLLSPYNYVTAEAYDENSYFLGSGSTPVYVTSGNVGVFKFYIYDTLYSKIYDANLYVFDIDANPGTWVLYGVNATGGSYITEVNISHAHYIWANLSGYNFLYGRETGDIYQQTIRGCVTYSIPFPGMKEIGLVMERGTGANTTAIFTIETLGSDLLTRSRVPNAKITITSHQSTDVIYTDAYGVARFNMIASPVLNYNYKVEYTDVEMDCYRTSESYFNSQSSQSIYVLLDSCWVITTLPTVTPTITPTPTETYLPGPGEEGGNIFTWFIRLFQIAGAGTENNARLMLALVITSALAFIFGWYISFQASLIGAFIGFVMCIAFGLIPMWILISLIFIGGVFFVGKWWSGSDSGG